MRPNDGARRDERHSGNAVDDPAENDFELVHGVDVSHAQRGEHGQVHDADAAAEIAAIDGDEQLEEGGSRDGGVGGIVRDARRNAPRQVLAEGEK